MSGKVSENFDQNLWKFFWRNLETFWELSDELNLGSRLREEVNQGSPGFLQETRSPLSTLLAPLGMVKIDQNRRFQDPNFLQNVRLLSLRKIFGKTGRKRGKATFKIITSLCYMQWVRNVSTLPNLRRRTWSSHEIMRLVIEIPPLCGKYDDNVDEFSASFPLHYCIRACKFT